MRYLKFLAALLATIGLTYLLNSPPQIGGQSLPNLGNLFSPFTGFWQNAEALTTIPNETLKLAGIKGKASITYDDRMIPHIFADEVENALFLQGYITAQNRLWQIDMSARATEGRLAEILGANMIEYDKKQRRIGMNHAAENALKGWKKNPKSFKRLEAYCNGINAYIKQLQPKDYPVEYKLMGFEPEEWSPYKSALFMKNMSWRLAGREDDRETTNARALLGKEAFDFIYPFINKKQRPIIPKGTAWDFEAQEVIDTVSTQLGAITPIKTPYFPQEPRNQGSNNWAVKGEKTANGNPILCNDPHLILSYPSVWYEIQLHTKEFNSYGVSLPGLPGVIIGFNENVAWGQTNVNWDLVDWYKVKWTDTTRQTYLYDGVPKAATIRIEEIKVKGSETVKDTIRYTHWGPTVHEIEEDGKPVAMVMRWQGHEESGTEELDVFYKLNKAKNYADYKAALKGYGCPPQNYAFASKDNDIAITVQGKFPIRRKGQGRLVQDGNRSTGEWQGYIPQNQVPQMKNPTRGYIASANQHSTDASYPYPYMSGSYFENYRGRYLNMRLDSMEDITIEDMMALQNSDYSVFAAEAMPKFLAYLNKNGLTKIEQNYLKYLENWKYNYNRDSVAPAIFQAWWDVFEQQMWDEVYTLEEKSIIHPERWRTIELLEQDSANIYFDVKETLEKETATDIVTESFRQTCAILDSFLIKNLMPLTWRNYKNTAINHLARIPAFSKTNVNVSGHRSTLNANNDRNNGPSWRMIVELGDTVKAYGIYPAGQSGNVGSQYYDNFVTKWEEGTYYELLFLKDATVEHERIVAKVQVN